METDKTRRDLLKDAALVGAAAAAVRAAGTAGAAETATRELPKIKLGTLEVSRLILGSNPFFGFDHGNPQASSGEMRKYYTERRIMAVLDAAAEQGITAVWTPCYDHWIRLWNRYRKNGGKLKIWIGQPDSFDKMKEHITACAKNGGQAVCIQGECIDRHARAGRWDAIRAWLEHIKGLNLPAGMATHRPQTHLAAEKHKLPTDFYHQCLFQPENYSKKVRELAMATIRKLDKPVVGYKVLAAGRLSGAEGLGYAFKHLRRKDGVCVGVFPKNQPGQIAENAALTAKLTAAAERPA